VHLRRARRRVKVSTVSPFIYLCIPAITFPSLLFLRSPFRSSLAIIFSPPRLFAVAFDPLPHFIIPAPSSSLPHQPYPSIPSHRSHPSPFQLYHPYHHPHINIHTSPFRPHRCHLTVPTSPLPPHCPHLTAPTSPSPPHRPHLTIPISPSPPSCHSLSSSLPYHSRLTIPIISSLSPSPHQHPHLTIPTSPLPPHCSYFIVPTLLFLPLPPIITAPNHLTIPTSSSPHHRPHIIVPTSPSSHHSSHIIVPHHRHHINVTTLLYPPPYYHIPVLILWPHSTALPFSSSLPILQRSPFPAVPIYLLSIYMLYTLCYVYLRQIYHVYYYLSQYISLTSHRHLCLSSSNLSLFFSYLFLPRSRRPCGA